ncbi:hypothetical protein GCM10010329_07720 [Streptomyces spiroverticillatus]|uniref:Uncharacterized protein n=1 Tax=Streptomyces finlayi TaxID=67296 RepID=A0A919C7R1_9ACTN|nr:hypothetical protein GCM10010329_07720 [Streptomyces spiroverticillatus]GHC80571.1 hypothetical protein GCM10010334_07710 [Streptomyces finlayi]
MIPRYLIDSSALWRVQRDKALLSAWGEVISNDAAPLPLPLVPLGGGAALPLPARPGATPARTLHAGCAHPRALGTPPGTGHVKLRPAGPRGPQPRPFT